MEGQLATYARLSVRLCLCVVYVLRDRVIICCSSLSFYSAHVSVDPTVVVRVMLDRSQCVSQHNQNGEFCVSVSSCSSPVPSLALCVGSSDQCAVMRVCHLCHAA